MKNYRPLIIFCIFVILGAIVGLHLLKNTDEPIIDIDNNPETHTGYEINILSGGTEMEILPVEIPNDERGYLDYILEKGISGIDYISVKPPRQPAIHGTKEENNNLMYSYIHRNRITFDMPNTDKTPYIMFITKKEIPDNRDIFLGLDGKVAGAIRKNKSLPIYDTNEYLYPLHGIVIAGKDGALFDVKSHIKNNKLQLNLFVGESGNYVEKIIIFFK